MWDEVGSGRKWGRRRKIEKREWKSEGKDRTSERKERGKKKEK